MRSARLTDQRREHYQEAPVFVVGGEEIGRGFRRKVALSVHSDSLVERPDSPFQNRSYGVLTVSKDEAEYLFRRPTNDVLFRQAGQFKRTVATANQPPFPIGREEGSVRSGVVIVEQFENEPIATAVAARGLSTESRMTIGSRGAVTAVWTDEWVRHLATRLATDERETAASDQPKSRIARWAERLISLQVQSRDAQTRAG